MRETISLNAKEQKRLIVLNRLDRGEMTVAEAAAVMGLSVRQVQRLHAAYTKEGAAALAHGNRGRRPTNAIDAAVGEQVAELARTRYAGCNQQHLTDLLAEREGIILHVSTVKRMLGAQGIRSPRTRRGRKHRRRRDRYPMEGMLLQIDGSRHPWLENRGPWLSLVLGIDDATGEVPAALFREQEDAAGYLELLQQVVTLRGRPLAVYHDRHDIFERSKSARQTIEEELSGGHVPTQVERALQELVITSIPARSPQAKGRVERVFGTLQDRLTSELRLANITTLAEGNAFLPGFLARFNALFRVPPGQEGCAYRPLEEHMRPEEIFCLKYLRRVGTDNVVRFLGRRLQISPCHGRVSYAKCWVEVHERLDGSLAVYWQGRCLAHADAPQEAGVLRTHSGQRRPQQTQLQVAAAAGSGDMWAAPSPEPAPPPTSRPHIPTPRKPAPDHPWRRALKPQGDKVAERLP
jgi:transposase